MQQRAEQIVDLMDTQQRYIGQMQIARQEGDLLVGTFVPGPAFPSVKQLFRDFEEAVDVQALHVIDELDAAIAATGVVPTLARCTRAYSHPRLANLERWRHYVSALRSIHHVSECRAPV